MASDDLAGSPAARFRVVANDGVNIGFDESPPIAIPDKRPLAQILNPRDGADVPPGELLVLQGFGSDLEDGTLADASLEWRSDRSDAPLGVGAALPVEQLAAGAHRITLRVRDSGGQVSEASVSIYVGSRLYLPLVR